MARRHATHSEQIEALLNGSAYELVKSIYGTFHPEAYSEVFTVTRAQILEYLMANYALDRLVHMRPGDSEGVYAIPELIGFRVYEQYERGIRFEVGTAWSESKVWAQFVDYILKTSGTGLKFE